MICRTVQNLLAERALGILHPKKEARLQLHLDRCADCRQAAGELEKYARLLAEQMPLVLRPDLASRVVQRAAAQQEPQSRRLLWVPAMAAAVLLLLTLAWNQMATRPRLNAEEVMAYYNAELEDLGFWNNQIQDQDDDWNYELFGIPDTVSRHLL